MAADFSKFCYSLFKSTIEKNISYFENVRNSLKRGQMNLLLEEYLSIALFAAIVATALGSIISFAALIKTLSVPSYFLIIPAVIFGMVAGVFTFLLFLVYPGVVSGGVQQGIQMNLPFATTYMATVSGSGIPPYAIFKLLAQFKEYGEISREAQNISSEIEMFGKDLSSALRRAADRTPSEEFKELLWGMDLIISEGGDLRKFLTSSAQIYMEDYKRRMAQYSQTLSMFLEIYLTVVVVGSIFFIIIGAIMGTVSGAQSPLLGQVGQNLLVYLFLPFISIIFIILIKTTSPMK